VRPPPIVEIVALGLGFLAFAVALVAVMRRMPIYCF